MKHLFINERGAPFYVDPQDLVVHSLVFGPTRDGMSSLHLFHRRQAGLVERIENIHPGDNSPATLRVQGGKR